MMIRLYSIYDRVARVFSDPFVSINDATASRAFELSQLSPDSMLNAAPCDYQLFFLGEFDNHTGSFADDIGGVMYKVADGRPKEVANVES